MPPINLGGPTRLQTRLMIVAVTFLERNEG